MSPWPAEASEDMDHSPSSTRALLVLKPTRGAFKAASRYSSSTHGWCISVVTAVLPMVGLMTVACLPPTSTNQVRHQGNQRHSFSTAEYHAVVRCCSARLQTLPLPLSSGAAGLCPSKRTMYTQPRLCRPATRTSAQRMAPRQSRKFFFLPRISDTSPLPSPELCHPRGSRDFSLRQETRESGTTAEDHNQEDIPNATMLYKGSVQSCRRQA